MRRIVATLVVAVSTVALLCTPAWAGELEDAQARQRAVQAELDAATRAFVESRDGLEDAQAELARAEREAARLDKDVARVRAALEQQARSLYQTGGLDLVSSVLDAGPAGLAQRIELSNLIETQRAAELEEARRIIDGHALALADAGRARDRQRVLTAKQAGAVEQLTASFQEAEQLTDRIEAREAREAREAAARERARREAEARATTTTGAPPTTQPAAPPTTAGVPATRTTSQPERTSPPETTDPPTTTRKPVAKPKPKPVAKPKPAPAPALKQGAACPVARPRSFIDSWGAARSGGRSHKGTDIMAPYGTHAFAYVSGRISQARSAGGLGGNVIYLQGDNGDEYYYAHLQSFDVSSGQRVKAGQLVARVGATGNAPKNAPHLHFEVHPGGGAAVNPYGRLRAACG
jgi:murein DD-endopeptidase MepM/ murein hydrolase activator NlpD